jgi:DNA-binding NtrC family response regulator
MKPTVLYLDDDGECLNVFQQMFGDAYDVRVATSPAEARRMLAAQPADIVISDQTMPEIDGTEFLREVAAAYPDSLRVLLTGSVNIGGVFQEVGAGVVQIFLSKPWTDQSVRQLLERARVHSRLRQESPPVRLRQGDDKDGGAAAHQVKGGLLPEDNLS